MTTLLFNNTKTTGWGMAEMPMDGRRYKLFTERYVEDGVEKTRTWREEIPESGQPFFFIPSYGVMSLDEMRYLAEEYEYEKTHPNSSEQEWWAEHRAKARYMREMYDESRDARAQLIKRNPRTRGGYL